MITNQNQNREFFMTRPDVITLTQQAITRVEEMLNARGKPSVGIRIGVRTKGCNGMSYTLEYADEIMPGDEVVDLGSFKVLIEPKAMLFVIGTRMDFVEEKLKSGFVFQNPNEKGTCGCGESFHV